MNHMQQFTIISLDGPVYQVQANWRGEPNKCAHNFFAWADARKRA